MEWGLLKAGCRPGGEGWSGVRIQRDEAFLIKRKYLCLCAMAVGTQDNPENSLFKVQILKANTHF